MRRLDTDGLPVRGERKINAAQAGIVRRIFNDYAAGRAPQAIADDHNRYSVDARAAGRMVLVRSYAERIVVLLGNTSLIQIVARHWRATRPVPA